MLSFHVMDRGFFLTLYAIRRQLAAMPHELYLIRLIHHHTRRPFPGERLWTASQLSHGATVGFLRLRNREGCDVYIQPYAEDRNAGYILLDLDLADPKIICTMRAQGHEPCVVLQTSPGHLQAWVRVSPTPLEPAVATAIGKQLARAYRGDLASTDWRHLGRLAGFTNQKPTRRQPNGYAPWVKLLHAQAGLALHGAALVQAAESQWSPAGPPPGSMFSLRPGAGGGADSTTSSRQAPSSLTPAAAADTYSRWMNRLRIPQRFSRPDWSIADLWIAKELLARRTPTAQVQAILRLGSPGFPRRHSDPEDYLRRTLARATLELQGEPFPARGSTPGSCDAPCVGPTASPLPPYHTRSSSPGSP